MYLTTISQGCLILLFSHLSISYLVQYAKRWSSAKQVRESRQCKEGKTERPWDILGLGKIVASVQAVVQENPSEYLDTLWAEYGDTYVASFFGVKVAFTRDATNLRHILVSRWTDFHVGGKDIRGPMMRDIAPGNISVADGPAWREKRDMWRQQFSRLPGLFHMPSQDRHFRRLLARIPPNGETYDIQALVMDMATDVLYEVTTGDCPDCQLPTQQTAWQKQFMQAVGRVHRNVAWRGWLGPLSRFVPMWSWKKDVAIYHAYMDAIIDRKFAEIAQTTKSPDPPAGAEQQQRRRQHGGRSLLDGLLRYTDDRRQIRDAVISISFGNDSLACCMTATLWFLARDPGVYAKLRQSVLDAVGYEAPTYQQIGGFPYLQQVTNEGK